MSLKDFDDGFRAAETDIAESMARVKREIMDQREEILRAFICKYGFDPEECEQVLDMSDYDKMIIRWYVRKRGGKDVRSGI
jgi:hypothetical protein